MHGNIIAIKDVFQLSELFLNMTANCWRDFNVTPGIFKRHSGLGPPSSSAWTPERPSLICDFHELNYRAALARTGDVHLIAILRSEERRVGKECRSRLSLW